MTPILIETNSSHLKNQGWEGYFPFGNTNFQGGYVCFREGSLWMPILSHSFFAPSFTSNMWAECQVIECIEEHNKYTTSTCKKEKNHTHTQNPHKIHAVSTIFPIFFRGNLRHQNLYFLVYYMKRCFFRLALNNPVLPEDFPAKLRSKWGSIQLDRTLPMDGDDGPLGPLSVVLSFRGLVKKRGTWRQGKYPPGD